MMIEMGEGHIEPSFVFISFGIGRQQRFQHGNKPQNLLGSLQNFFEMIVQQRARRRQERISFSYRRLTCFF